MSLHTAERARVVTLYDDLAHPDLEALWPEVIARGDTWTVFQERWWLSCWWSVFGRGELIVAVVRDRGAPVCIAPLFHDGGMVFFVGSGGSDYLDFIGSTGEPGTLEALIAEVLEHRPDTLGVRFYHVPDRSRTGMHLQRAAGALGLACFDEGALPAPVLDMGPDGSHAVAAARKKSLLRHERRLQREGALRTTHLRAPERILPLLDAFFAQHEKRWSRKGSPSIFEEPSQRAFYRKLVETAQRVPWLRFTVVEWNEAPVAFHFGFSHRGRYLWYKPSFEIDLARSAPGEVLLRELLLAAVDEGAHTFDFGLGDEDFKQRFATATPEVRTWGLYPAH